VSAPNASNSELSTVTSGLPPVQQYNNTLRLLFMQMGEVVVALDPSTGQQVWAHPTYNQSTPTITGYRCWQRLPS
jgi:outer membrane protein assembly factor BamB